MLAGGAATVSITPITLTGISTYASDFQSILNRAVGIAQIPLTNLQNKDATVLQQKTDLSSLNGAVGALATSLQALGTLASSQAVSASSSDPTVLTATASGPPSAFSYTINSVTSLASAAAERSLNSYSSTAPVSSTGIVQLTLGAKNYVIPLAHNTLVGLRDQINALGAGVSASILTTAGGNYLSLGASAAGATTLSLTDDPTTGSHTGTNVPLLTSTNQGSNAQFQLNGINITQSSNQVNSVIPGVSFQLLAKSANPVTISLATDPTTLSGALQTFVDNLNALNTAIQGQVGTGSLAGGSIVTGLESTVNQLTSYHLNTGSVQSLADLGITFDSTGKATFDQTTFDALSSTQIADGFKFLGSATSGLAGFAQSLTEYSDPVTGLIASEEGGLTLTDQHLQSQITTLTAQINVNQTSLSQRLARADAQVAQLTSQQSALTASLQGLSLVLYGQNPQVA
jgi:flagellar hook-associated protein 2